VLPFFVIRFELALAVAALLLALARVFYLWNLSTIDVEKRQAGLKAEHSVCEMLKRELPSDWLIEPNVRVPGCGDVDVFVTSPKRKYYAIEVKSHRTNVIFDGDVLRRGDGRAFEKDFLFQASRTAVAIAGLRNISRVNALLVFTRAKLSLPANEIQGVRILRSRDLVTHLLSQDTANAKEHLGQN
jgi:hypothetical protein